MHVAELTVRDFRSYEEAHLALGPGRVSIVGANGQGKTNLVEAIDYLSALTSHRVSQDAPLVRHGAERAHIAARVVRFERSATLEVEIVPGSSNRARINGAALPRARELLGVLRCVVFAPDDLALIKGDPSNRRRFCDLLAAQRAPRLAGVRADYERVLKQRNALLKSARQARGSGQLPSTLEVWDEHLARAGAELMAARIDLLADLAPYLEKSYATVAELAAQNRQLATARYESRVDPAIGRDPAALAESLIELIAQRRREELERGLTLVGPHRDDVALTLGELPAKGYASHGETWSFALALRLAAFELLRADGDDPVLILDDVFAELDVGRRERLSDLVAELEQVIVTAAVEADVPPGFADRRLRIAEGRVIADE